MPIYYCSVQKPTLYLALKKRNLFAYLGMAKYFAIQKEFDAFTENSIYNFSIPLCN